MIVRTYTCDLIELLEGHWTLLVYVEICIFDGAKLRPVLASIRIGSGHRFVWQTQDFSTLGQ